MGFLSAFQKRSNYERQPGARFSGILENYLRALETNGGTMRERSITLIARSPSAGAVRALIEHANAIERQQVTVQIIFAKLAPVDALIELAAALHITPRHEAATAIRFIKHPGLLFAHEQLVLGSAICWTGDMLRRSEEQRNGLDILEVDAPGSVRLGEFAFHAIWNCSKPVPARAFAAPRRLFQPPAEVQPELAAAELASDNGTPVHRTARITTRH
jgi:hypothetical protein